jgi:hypothetical protein
MSRISVYPFLVPIVRLNENGIPGTVSKRQPNLKFAEKPLSIYQYKDLNVFILKSLRLKLNLNAAFQEVINTFNTNIINIL